MLVGNCAVPPTLLRQGWRSSVIVRSVILSVSRITYDHGNGRP